MIVLFRSSNAELKFTELFIRLVEVVKSRPTRTRLGREDVIMWQARMRGVMVVGAAGKWGLSEEY